MPALRVLFVDDDADLRQAFMQCFSSPTCCIDSAPDASVALAMLDRQAFDVVLSDYNMPGLTGNQFLLQVARRSPGVRRVLVSGSRVVTATGAEFFVAKPWSADDMRELLQQLSAGRPIHGDDDTEQSDWRDDETTPLE